MLHTFMVRGTVFCVGALLFMKTKVCINCNRGFKVPNKRFLKAIYCSVNCRYEHKRYKVVPGIKNNMLTIINEVHPEIQHSVKNGEQKIRKIECICDCGKIIITRLKSFLSGYAKSCGCISKIGRDDSFGNCISRHPLHRVWSNMIQRCTNPKNGQFNNYGGRGVVVCDEWRNSYKAFYTWALQNGWKMGLMLDKDLHGSLVYSPSTCLFVTKKVSANNHRRNRVFYINDERFTLAQLCEKYKITRTMVDRNIKNGQPILIALTKKYKGNANKCNL